MLWWIEDERLDPIAAGAVRDPANEVLVSVVSVWEIAIKRALGKLEAPADLRAALDDAGFRQLPITTDHALATGELPPFHRDPFDRMLVAQARCERLALVTSDPAIGRYDVETIPASNRSA